MKTNNKGNGSPVLNNLPPKLSPFVNREEEIRQAISALLDSKVPIVALVGIAGIGKTSLALEIAHRLSDMGEFAGGIMWLPARDLQSLDDLTDIIGTALGVPIAEVHSRLNSQRCLVILDGLDELSHQHESGVERFLETLPAPSKALVTSRKRFGISSQATVIQVASFDERTAIELFTALGGQQDREVSYIDHQTSAEIVRALGYHPLALTLAARLVRGNYAEARKIFEQTLDVLGDLGNDRERAALLHTLASVSQAQGDYSQALQLYQRSLSIAEQLGDLQAKSATLNNLAQIYFMQGDLDGALRLYYESLALKEQIGDVYGKSATLHNMAQIFVTRGDLDRALQLYQESLALKEQLGDVYGKSATLNNMAQIFVTRGDLDHALQLYQESLALEEQLGDVYGKSATLNNMAQIFVTRGDLDRALQLYQESLALKEQLGDVYGMATTQNNLAAAYAQRIRGDRAENIEQAIFHYQQALEVYTRQAYPEQWATTQNNLANAYSDRIRGDRAENIEQAIFHYQQALEVYTREAFSEQSAVTQNNLANAYRNRIRGDRAENIEQAIFRYQQALITAREIGDKNSYSNISLELGKLYIEQGRWYDALHLFEESLAIHRQGDDLDARADTIYQIARTHHLIGNLAKARTHYRDALRLYEHTRNQSGLALCKTGLGRLMIQMGFLDDAIRELESAKRTYGQMGEERRAAEVEEVLQMANHVKERQPV